MDEDGIDISVLYPTMLLGLFGYPDRDVALATARAYNDWLADHCAESDGRLYGAAVIPQWDAELAAAEIRRAGTSPYLVAAFLRPNPTIDWKPLSDPAYDPIWAGRERRRPRDRLPSAALGRRARCVPGTAHQRAPARHAVDARRDAARVAAPRRADGLRQPLLRAVDRQPGRHDERDRLHDGRRRVPALPRSAVSCSSSRTAAGSCRGSSDSTTTTRSSASTCRGSTEEPSAFFRRSCWISFDPDESTLAFTASSPVVGADRIVWASDYPHPDAKYPGTTRELDEATASLGDDARRTIAGTSTLALYAIDV